jgi:DNA-binding LytR/AlgR family response regulator
MYTAPYKLFELENILPSSFVRISKSSIANVMRISSLSRELVGNGEITFTRSDKKTYFSRGYYKILRDRIEEIRFS